MAKASCEYVGWAYIARQSSDSTDFLLGLTAYLDPNHERPCIGALSCPEIVVTCPGTSYSLGNKWSMLATPKVNVTADSELPRYCNEVLLCLLCMHTSLRRGTASPLCAHDNIAGSGDPQRVLQYFPACTVAHLLSIHSSTSS